MDKDDEATEIIFFPVVNIEWTAWRIPRSGEFGAKLDLNDVSCDVRPRIDCFISSLTNLFPFCIFGSYGVNQLL